MMIVLGEQQEVYENEDLVLVNPKSLPEEDCRKIVGLTVLILREFLESKCLLR